MTENLQFHAGFLSDPILPIYRVIVLTKSNTVHDIRRVSADDDAQAIERAKMMVDGHAVELWAGLRFIDHFAPVG